MPVISPIWSAVKGRMSATGIGAAAIPPATAAAAAVIFRASFRCTAWSCERRAIWICALRGSTSTR